MKFNNPARAILTEAGRIWGDDYGKLDSNRIGCFLSIGTGFPRIARLETNALWQKISNRFQIPFEAVRVMKAIISDVNTTHMDMMERLNREVYHRFNVEQGLQEVELFEYEKLQHINTDTDEYLSQKSREIVDCVKIMISLGVNLPAIAFRADSAEVLGTPAQDDLQRRLDALSM